MSGLDVYSTDNPIVIFDCRLTLDGTAGRREITAAYRPLTPGTSDLFRLWYVRNGQWGTDLITVDTITSPASVTVIPGTPTSGIVLIGIAAIGRRRRR